VNESYPLVSIVTPSYNQGSFISDAIESVLAQNYPHLQHIVIDGGSTDNTVEVLKRYPHLEWISEKDNGQSDALNKGFRRARGDIIGWLNSDDTYTSQAISTAVSYFSKHPQVGMVYAPYNIIDQKGEVLAVKGSSKFDIKRHLCQFDLIGPITFFRAEIFGKIGWLDPSFHYTMDYEYWLRIAFHFEIHFIPAILGNFRIHSESKTGADADNFWPELQRAHDKFFSHAQLPSELFGIRKQVRRALNSRWSKYYVDKGMEKFNQLSLVEARHLWIKAIQLKPTHAMNLHLIATFLKTYLGSIALGKLRRLRENFSK